MITGSWWCSGMGVGSWAVMIAFWTVLLGVIVWAVTRLFPSTSPVAALDLLDRRFAAGDLDAETYRQARTELTGTARPLPGV